MGRLLAHCILTVILCGTGFSSDTYLILPFHNAAANPGLDWIGESLAEMVRDALASYELIVIGRDDFEEAAHRLSLEPGALLTKGSMIYLAREMGADWVLHGRFVFTPSDDSEALAAGSLEVEAAAIDATKAVAGPIWKESGPMAGLSALQSRLAWRVLRNAAPGASPTEEEFFENRPPVRIDAMESYVRGMLAPDLDQKHRFFTLAANLEPGFSQPRFQLGLMQWDESSYRSAARWLEQVSPADAHYLEANFLLGLCRYYSGAYAGALAAFEVVAKAVPLDEVYNNVGLAQFRDGIPSAIETLRWALGRAPSDPDYHFNVGYVSWRQGDLDGAVESFRKALELDPRDDEARQMLERCEKRSGPRRGDLSSQGLERLKENFDELSARRLAIR